MLENDDIQKYIEKQISEGDELVGFFSGNSTMDLQVLVIAPAFAGFTIKVIVVAVTKRCLMIHLLNKFGTKFLDYSSIEYSDIDSIKFGMGLIQRPVKIKLKSGDKLKIKAQVRALVNCPKLTDDLQDYITKQVLNNKG